MRVLTLFMFVASLPLLYAGCRNEPPAEPEALADTDGTTSAAARSADSSRTAPAILFFGDSITAGYGLDPQQAFPALIQQRLDSAGIAYRVVNAGLSGETSAGGLRRIDWVLKGNADVVVVELGGNDGLRGIPTESTRQNLQEIIDRVRQTQPDASIILAGMQIPPSMGEKYASDFRSIFPELARKNDLPLIPFILEGVGGRPGLNQADGIHPTAKGHKIVAENVWAALEPVLATRLAMQD